MKTTLQMPSLHDFFHVVSSVTWEAELGTKILEGAAAVAKVVRDQERQLQSGGGHFVYPECSQCSRRSVAGLSATNVGAELEGARRCV